MAVCFDFSLKFFVSFIVLVKFYGFYAFYSTSPNYDLFISSQENVDCRPNDSLFTAPSSLLWTRPPGCVPFRPRSRLSVENLLIPILLLSGDIETNPGPSSTCGFNIGYVNARSLVKKTAIVHSLIDELSLDCLAITESWIKSDHPDAIKLDAAPPGFTVLHVHRHGAGMGGGVAFVCSNDLSVHQVTLTGSYQPCDILAVCLQTRKGRLNIIVLYRPPQSPGFEDQLEELFDEVHYLVILSFAAILSVHHRACQEPLTAV